MRFMILRKADADTEAGVMPSEDLLAAMGEYNDRLIDAGVMETGEGLKPSREGFRVTFEDGRPVVTDGPFAETRELLAGFTIIDVESKQAAIDWVRQWPPLDGDGQAVLEVRPFFAMEDFAPGPALDHIEAQFARRRQQPDTAAVYLNFEGNCREAFEFYADRLGGVIEESLSHEQAPADMEVPDAWREKIMHARLNLGRQVLMGTDVRPENFQPAQGFSVQLGFDDPERARQAFDELAEGGQIRMPFEPTFWCRGFGLLTDRFAVPWMINCNRD